MSRTEQPLISVVTASYNYRQFLRAALDSVGQQAYPNKEHVIFDGESTDGSVDMLRTYAADHPHVLWVSEPDEGQSDAINKGFRSASGEIIGWLNADDYYLPGCLEAVAEAFARHPEVDILYADFRFIDGEGRVLQLRQELDFDPFMLKYLHVLYIPTTATFFRRKVFEEGNFLDAAYHYSMDYEFFVRLAQRGYRFKHIPVVVADFRWHAESKSSTQQRGFREEQIQALYTHDPLFDRTPPLFREPLRRLLCLLAQTKRYSLKLATGKYRGQWVSPHESHTGA